MKPIQERRRAKGLCIDCGDPTENGKSRCPWCLKKIAMRQREYEAKKRAENPDAYRDAKLKYQRKWKAENPEKMELYKQRKPEYNRRYMEG